jgi:hypothetical protein
MAPHARGESECRPLLLRDPSNAGRMESGLSSWADGSNDRRDFMTRDQALASAWGSRASGRFRENPEWIPMRSPGLEQPRVRVRTDPSTRNGLRRLDAMAADHPAERRWRSISRRSRFPGVGPTPGCAAQSLWDCGIIHPDLMRRPRYFRLVMEQSDSQSSSIAAICR